MGQMKNLYLEREDCRRDLSGALGVDLTIVEHDDPRIWIYQLPDGRTITYTYTSN